MEFVFPVLFHFVFLSFRLVFAEHFGISVGILTLFKPEGGGNSAESDFQPE